MAQVPVKCTGKPRSSNPEVVAHSEVVPRWPHTGNEPNIAKEPNIRCLHCSPRASYQFPTAHVRWIVIIKCNNVPVRWRQPFDEIGSQRREVLDLRV